MKTVTTATETVHLFYFLHILYTITYIIPTVLRSALSSETVENVLLKYLKMKTEPRLISLPFSVRKLFGHTSRSGTRHYESKFSVDRSIWRRRYGVDDTNNNVPIRRHHTKKRSAPARAQLVARSIQCTPSETSQRKKSKQLKIKSKKSISINKKSKRITKSKDKVKSPTITSNKRKCDKLIEQSLPSTSAQSGLTTMENKRLRKSKMTENSVEPICQVSMSCGISPTRYSLVEVKDTSKPPLLPKQQKDTSKPTLIPKQQDALKKLRTPIRSRGAQSSVKRSDDVTAEWPSLGETSRRKGTIKEAATEIVRNKQSGTVAKRTRQKWEETASVLSASSASGEVPNASQLVRSWASVAAPSTRVETRSQKAKQESPLKLAKTASKRNDNKPNVSRRPDNSQGTLRRHTIERRRSLQRQKTQKDKKHPGIKDATSKGINGQLRWKIDHMPESLRFVKPPRGVVSLMENQLEATRAAVSSTNVNRCNNRRFCLGDFISGGTEDSGNFSHETEVNHKSEQIEKASGETNQDCEKIKQNPCETGEQSEQINEDSDESNYKSGESNHEPEQINHDFSEQKDETDMCTLLNGLSTCELSPRLSSDQVPPKENTEKEDCEMLKSVANGASSKNQNKDQCKETSSPKKVSHRYRALLRDVDGRMSAKALTEAMTRKKKDDALLEMKSVTKVNRKRKRRKLMQKSRGEPRDEQRCPSDEFSSPETPADESFHQGTSASFSSPDVCEQKSETVTSSAAMTSPAAVRELCAVREQKQKLHPGVDQSARIVCEETDEEEVTSTGSEERLDGCDENTDEPSCSNSKDFNNSFVEELMLGLRDGDLDIDAGNIITGCIGDKIASPQDQDKDFTAAGSILETELLAEVPGKPLRKKDMPKTRAKSVTNVTNVTNVTSVTSSVTRLSCVISMPDVTTEKQSQIGTDIDTRIMEDINIDWWMKYLFEV